MGDLDRKVSFEIGLDATPVEQGTQRVNTALDSVNQRLQQMGQRAAEGGALSTRTLTAMGLQLKEAAAAADSLTTSQQAQLASAEKTYQSLLQHQREYNEQLQQVQTQTRNWIGLQASLEGVGGSFGKIAQTAFGVVGALTAGWEAGRKLDEGFFSKLPNWKKSWDDLATSVLGYDAAVKSTADFANDPRFAGTRTQQLLPSIIARQGAAASAYDVGQQLQSRGVTTVEDVTKQLADFDKTVALINQHGGAELNNFLDASKSKLEGWAKAFHDAGQQVPDDLQGFVDKLEQFSAAVTNAQTKIDSLKASQGLQSWATSLFQFFQNVQDKFRPDAADPISQIIQQVSDLSKQTQEEIAKQIQTTNQDLDLQKAKYAELGAEISQLQAEGTPGPQLDAEIAKRQAARDATIEQAQADQEALQTLTALSAKVPELAANLQQIKTDDALGKMAAKADAAFAALEQTIAQTVAATKRELAQIPGGQAFLGQADQAGQQAENLLTLSLVVDPSVKPYLQQTAADFAKTTGTALKDAARETHQQLVDAAQAISSALKDGSDFLSGVLTDFAVNGGKNFGQILQGFVAKGTSQGIQQLLGPTGFGSIFSGALGPNGIDISGMYNSAAGAYINPQTGAPFPGTTDQQQLAARSQQLNNYINGSLAAAAAVYNSLTNGSTASLGGFAQDAVTYGGIGAQVGGAYGAIIGVIVAGIVQAFKPSMVDVADFATYNVRHGTASYLENTVTPAQSMIQQQQVQDAVNSTFNAFTSILLKMPEDILSKLIVPITSIGVSGGKWDPSAGGLITNYGKSDFQNSLKDFNAWLQGTLPQDIAEQFKPALERGFNALGLSNGAFEKYWEEMKGVDPQKAQQFWSDMTDFLTSWQNVQTEMANIDAATGPGTSIANWNLDANGAQRPAGQSDYMAGLKQAESGIRDLTNAVATLTGPDQIAAAKELGASVGNVMQSLVGYLNLVATTAKAIGDDIRSRLLALDLDQAKGNPQQQQDLIYADYQRLKNEIANAKALGLSPDQLRSDETSAANDAYQIYQLDPDAAHAQWYRDQLNQLNTISQQQLKAMGDQAKDEVQKLLDSVKPFVDYLTGDTTDALKDMNTAAAGASSSLVDFGTALDLLAARITGDQSFTDSQNQSGSGNPNRPPPHPGWVYDPGTGTWGPPAPSQNGGIRVPGADPGDPNSSAWTEPPKPGGWPNGNPDGPPSNGGYLTASPMRGGQPKPSIDVQQLSQIVAAIAPVLKGELNVYVDGVYQETVDLRAEGFARRTLIARARR